MADDSLRTDGARWRTLIRRVSPVDALLLASVPLAILAVFSLPAATRETLVFQYAAPSVRTAFLAPFVHFDPGHLLFNLVGYALIVSALYVLSLSAGHLREFRVVFLALLVSSPLLLSYLNLTVVRGGVTFGFSGVLMAYYGYLPLTLAEHAESRLDLGQVRTVAPLLFFVGLTLVTIQTLRAVLANPVTVAVDGVPTSVTWVLVATLAELLVLLVVVVVFYSLYVAGGQTDLRTRLVRTVEKEGHFELAVLATVLFLAIPFLTFPADPIVGERVFNLYVHFVGYALGFIATFAYRTL
jgi:hypothetical protein